MFNPNVYETANLALCQFSFSQQQLENKEIDQKSEIILKLYIFK